MHNPPIISNVLTLIFFLMSGMAMADAPAVSSEGLLADAIDGLRNTTSMLTGKQGWKLVFRHRSDLVGLRKDTGVAPFMPGKGVNDADVKETQEWTVTVIRQADDIIVHRDRPDGSRDSSAWASGIGAEARGTVGVVSPSGSVGIFQATPYINYLFIDVSPTNLLWDQSTQGAMSASRPSELFVWALPRTIILHRPEFRASIDAQRGIVKLKRDGHDEIELNPKLDYACISRRYEFKPGVPLFEVENKDFIQAAPHIWLPRVQLVKKYYTPPASPTIYGNVLALERNELVSFELNKFNPADFQVDMKNAVYVHDRVRKVSFRRIPKGTTPEAALDASIKEAIGTGAYGNEGSGWSKSLLLVVNAGILFSLMVWFRSNHLRRLRSALS